MALQELALQALIMVLDRVHGHLALALKIMYSKALALGVLSLKALSTAQGMAHMSLEVPSLEVLIMDLFRAPASLAIQTSTADLVCQ